MAERVRTRVFPGPQNLALFVAEAKGFFAGRGIDVEIGITAGSDEQRKALASGVIDVVHAAVDNAVHAVEVAGDDVVIVCGGSNGMNELMVGPEVRSYADLRGRTVVVDAPDTAYAFQLYFMLAMNGLAREAYGVLPAGGAKQRLHAMREGAGAAAMLNPPWNFVARREGYRSFGTAVEAIGAYQADGAFARRSWAQRNADTLARYLQGMIDGLRWAFDPVNRTQAVAILAERLRIEADIAARSVEAAVGPTKGLAVDARFDIAGFENTLRIRDRIAGTWAGRLPPPGKYLDLSHYERALATL